MKRCSQIPSEQNIHLMTLDVKKFIDDIEMSPHFDPIHKASLQRIALVNLAATAKANTVSKRDVYYTDKNGEIKLCRRKSTRVQPRW